MSTRRQLDVAGSVLDEIEGVLTPAALQLVSDLTRRFKSRITEALDGRQRRQLAFDAGHYPDFLRATADIREDNWQIAPVPADLQDRRVEITGPPDRKMVINALNSGAQVFMADFEDAMAPSWANVLSGQRNVMDAVRRTITYVQPETGREYRLQDRTAVLIVRPRGLHLVERHHQVDGEPVPASLFDVGVFLANNAHELLRAGSGPYLYLPKLESHLEARLWNDVFLHAQEALGLPIGTIKSTVLIETLPAAFEMDEILFELRDHITGLNCGRWDYIFSSIKTRRRDAEFLLPDRSLVTMSAPSMRAYSRLLIRTCHRRGAHAMGGMAAQIPLKDPVAHELAIAQVEADKHREVQAGHDGTWVAHPALVPVARAIFDAQMPWANQVERVYNDGTITADDLLARPEGRRTEQGLRVNIRVGIQYLAAWLGGVGCVPLNGLMEDAATAEISRAQVWQWVHHRVELDDHRHVTPAWVRGVIAEELDGLRGGVSASAPLDRALALFEDLVFADDLVDFLTIPAYELLTGQLSRPVTG